ncbi:hypothetical protein [Treponema sp.]|uniref:hypothetical protein n=1 Tax=Treponema sp. TaxID=166 RepID=UPI0025DDD42E|nr:hypothetical protein [Treponema sp.]MCR5218929.1 hypothetical protein [Treponema sp.]
MKFTKKALLGCAVLATAGLSFAQDYDDFDAFASDAPETSFTAGGTFETTARSYLDEADHEIEGLDDISTLHTEAGATGKLNLTYSGISSELNAVIKFDSNSLGEYPEDILDEFTARAFMGNLILEAGKMRVVWGKGDKNHVVDNFNANDYTDYIFPDYLDRRIAEPMFRAVYATNSDVKFEAIWTPVMTADRLASSGNWQPKASKALTSTVKSTALSYLASATEAKVNANQLATEFATLYAEYSAGDTNAGTALTSLLSSNATTLSAYGFDGNTATAAEAIEAYVTAAETAYLTALSNTGSLTDSLYPDTYQLKYGQAGLRTTFTAGGFDLGFSYYYGHYKQPSANLSKMEAYATKVLTGSDISESDKFLAYDKLQVFGIEGATVFGPLNIRFEAAYNLTEDTDGDDPWVHNNSIAWEAGFDMDLPVSNVNFNIQTVGKYILNGDKINDGIYKAYDVDGDANDCYTNNKIIVDITDSYRNDSIKLDIKGVWGIERGDVVVMPSLTFDVRDDMTLSLSGLYIWCKDEDSEFDGWENNSFAQVGIKYLF